MITEKTINGNKYQFASNTWSTSRAWGHETRLHRNGFEISSARVRYYNRTWECYQYQTAMQYAVGKLLDHLEREIISDYKREHGIKRMSAEMKQAAIKADAYCNEIRELYKSL